MRDKDIFVGNDRQAFREIHRRYGERLKAVIMGNCGLDYVEASAVVTSAIFDLARQPAELRGYVKEYSLFPRMVSVAFAIADELNRRAA